MPYKPQIGLPHEKPKLKKALGLFEVTIYGVGIILGAGIYALIGEAAAVAGNALWIAFFVGAVIAAFTGLSYAELGTMYPKEAAEYVYSKKAFNSNLLSFLVGWLIIFVEIVAAATVALGFGGYFYSLTGFSPILSAIILIGILSFLNFWGIKESARFNVIFTLIEAAGLILIIVLGLNYFGSVNYFEAPQGFSGILMAAILVFFAYIGFEDMVNVAEETRKPRKVIPKALIISLIITTLVYMLVSIASVSVIPWNELGASSAPLAAVSEKAWTGSSSLLSIIALFATGNTVLILLIVTSRMIYGMADKKSLPKYLSKIHLKRRTPYLAILLSMIVAMLFVLIGNIRTIAEMTNFGAFLIFLIVNLSLIKLRYKKPRMRRMFKSPINIGRFPVLAGLGVFFCFIMLLYFGFQIILYLLAVLFAGFIFYKGLNRKKNI